MVAVVALLSAHLSEQHLSVRTVHLSFYKSSEMVKEENSLKAKSAGTHSVKGLFLENIIFGCELILVVIIIHFH